ncbi:hypothetical protein EDB89DRAFT_1911983 [Lactarius sanguifluus]|nr:hypothetical protein EDB89DRAFT_1911983 [Lactarius sanguifluus]
MWGEGWGSAWPVRVAMLQGGWVGRKGGPPVLRPRVPQTGARGTRSHPRAAPTPIRVPHLHVNEGWGSTPPVGQKEGYPVLFTRAQTVFRDPSFRAPPRGEWERRKGERVKQGAAEGGTNGKGAQQHGWRGVGGGCHSGFARPICTETGAGGERRGAVPHKLAFASSSCLHMMNEGAGGRGEAYLSRAPFARKWVQGVHTKGGKERVGKGGWKGQAQDPTCVNTQM